MPCLKLFLTTIFMLAIQAHGLASTQVKEMTLHSVDGEAINLAEKKGKVIVLAFCATWIPQPEKRFPALMRLAEQYRNRGVEFYWVSIDSVEEKNFNHASDNELRAFAKQNNLSLKILRDPDLKAYNALGVDKAPALVILDPSGQVHSRHAGLQPDRSDVYQEITRNLNRLLK